MYREVHAVIPSSRVIDRCKVSVLPGLAFLAGAKLDVFTALSNGATKPTEIAAKLGVDPTWLTPLLYALVAAELLIYDEGEFRNTEEADAFLVRGSPHFIGGVYKLYEELWRGAFLAADSVKAARPLAEHDYAGMGVHHLKEFFDGQHPDALMAGWKLADAVDLSAETRLIDIGGGSGGIAIALCERYLNLQGTIAELPDVCAIAKQHIAEAGLNDRLQVIEHNAVAQPLEGNYDVAVMRALLQVLSATNCAQLLKNLRHGLSPGASLYILGQIADDDLVTPPQVAMFNLIFLSFYEEGRVFTEADHRYWLQDAGFVGIERRKTDNGLNMMIARVPD